MTSRKRIGKYEIWEEIARGGMGAVYRGFQPSLGRQVAIKMLLPDLAGDEDFLERFHMEAGAIALLNQANIVRIHDIQREDGTTYIIMEFVAGPSLRKVLRGAGVLDPGRAADLTIQAARGLAVAHAQGIIHRDIKPENLLLSSHGLLKVMDFGVAKLASSKLKTRTGTALGTPAYMSPEQARGEKVDSRSDLYALAIVLFELVTGRLPFIGSDPFAIALQHIRDAPPDPRELAPHLPPGLPEILLTGLTKNRDQRFQTTQQLIDALEPYAEAARTKRAQRGRRASLDRCPSCGDSLRPDFTTCPGCGQSLEQDCQECQQPFRLGLATCPFCWASAPKSSVPETGTARPSSAPESPHETPPHRTPSESLDGIQGIRKRLLERARSLDATSRPPTTPPTFPPPAPGAVTVATPPANPPAVCPECGGELTSGFVRCPFCGRSIE